MQVRELPLGRIVAAGAVVAAVIGVLVAAIVWPVLQRVDRTLGLIETSLPILQTIQPEVTDIGDDVDELVPAVEPVGPGLERLDGRIQDLSDPLVRLEGRIVDLQRSLTAVETLPVLREDVNAGLTALGEQLRATNRALLAMERDFSTTTSNIEDLTAAVTSLVERFDEVLVLLRETEQHAENLDRKTGPAPPDIGPGRQP